MIEGFFFFFIIGVDDILPAYVFLKNLADVSLAKADDALFDLFKFQPL